GDLPPVRRPDGIPVRYSVPRQPPQSAAVGIDQEELVVAGTATITRSTGATQLDRKDELSPVGRPGSAVVACQASCQPPLPAPVRVHDVKLVRRLPLRAAREA